MSLDKKTVNRILIIALAAVGVFVFFYFDLGRFLTLDYMKASQARFATLYEQHGTLVVAVYMAIYIAVTALSLPGAVIMTLAGGALFGLGVGTVAVSFASTIGATLAAAVARFILRDWVEEKFGGKLGPINEGIRNEGAFYLFTVRLIPVFPFFVINLVIGLTKMRLRTFFWVSQLGMLPGTLVYVNAGKELAKIDSLSGILSPSLIASFALLGVFPIVVKKIMGSVRARRARRDPGEERRVPDDS